MEVSLWSSWGGELTHLLPRLGLFLWVLLFCDIAGSKTSTGGGVSPRDPGQPGCDHGPWSWGTGSVQHLGLSS